MRWCVAAVMCCAVANAVRAEDALWGHWPLVKDARDHATHQRATVVGVDGHPPVLAAETGATFDGRRNWLITPGDRFEPGDGDFTIALQVHTDDKLRDDLGDLLSSWNPTTRTGFTLALRNNSGCTSSQSNWRHLQFGIDAGTEPEFRDEGRSGESLFGFALCVHDGGLYLATCEPKAGQAGHVYRYGGPNQWEDLGTLDGSNAVTALASYNGQLYAGTGKYRLGGSALTESENTTLGGKVYRFLEPGKWELVGDLSPTEAVAAFVTYDGRLYATSLYRPSGFFRYEADGQWTSLPVPDGKRVGPVRVHDGAIYSGSYDGGHVYRWQDEAWTDLGPIINDTQAYSFTTFGGKLHVGMWPSGRMFRLDPGDQWTDAGRLGEELEVMAQLVHNGSLYAGSLPLGAIYRYDLGDQWTRLKQLDETPDVKYRRVWTMATYQGRLFSTTLPSGKIWSMSTGATVSVDRELSPGWHHIVARRSEGKLAVFVDGKPVAGATVSPGLTLTETGPLQIGNGPGGPFCGRIKDVRIYTKALGTTEILRLAE